MKISFFVPGKAAPGGSKAIARNAAGVVVGLRDAGKGNAKWKRLVAKEGKKAYRGELLTGAVEVMFTFTIERPKKHFRTGKFAGVMRTDAPRYPIGPADVLKLARSTEDALTGVIWKDDAATVDLSLSKRYAGNPPYPDRPGVIVTIWTKE